MISQGVYVKSSSPPPAPPGLPLDPCSNSIATTSTHVPPPAVPPVSSEPRRLVKAPHPTHLLKCPRCASLDTKFCYYNNYSLSQPRYFCKNCKRYWTAGGVLRNVPVGGGLRKNKRFKLKLAAEAEAAAAAARESSAQQAQHYIEGKPPSPVQVAVACAAMGSSATSASSSVVSSVPANYVGAALPGYLPSTLLLRTSSGSDCSTIDYAGNDNCTANTGIAAPFLMQQQQSCRSQLQRFYAATGGHAEGRPQYYSSYASASLASSCNEQYSGRSSGEEGVRSSNLQHVVGYSSCTQPTPSSLNIDVEQVVRDDLSASAPYNAVVDKGSEGGRDVSDGHASIKDSSNSNYEWQFISENLFNGCGTEGFLPLPGGSWPDFSQFHDLTGPHG